VEFLLDPEDSMLAYEERGRRRNRTPSDTELEQNALAGMNHVQKIEMIQGKYTVIMLLFFFVVLIPGISEVEEVIIFFLYIRFY
jgi:hypothetical protein